MQKSLKQNIPFLVFIGIGIALALGGYLTSLFSDSYDMSLWTRTGLWISEIAGFFMLISNGTFILTRHFNILKGLFAVIIIGALFKILHWPYSIEILIIGGIGIILNYLIHFIKKPIKKRLDYLKLAWVIVYYGGMFFILIRLISIDYTILSSSLMWLAIIDYLIPEKSNLTS